MTKARKMLSMALAVLFTAFACLGTIPVHAKTFKPALPKVQIITQPKAEYTVGERVSFQVKAPNYGGKVQYRAILWDGNKKVQRELWPTMPGYFYTKWMPTGRTTFTIGWPIMEPGIYNVTVLVKVAGGKSKYDSYVKTTNFVVKAKDVVINTPGQTYGSADSTKVETIEKDVYIKADNVTLRNVKVLGTVYVDPGKDGTANLVNVVAKKINVLSGGKNSIHIKDSKADEMNASSESPVRIEVDGDTEIVGTTANGYIIFDKKSGTYGTITITKNDNGENVIEFRGEIKDEVVVEAAATISTPEGSKVENLKVAPEDPNAKVTLQGEYTNVAVEKKADVAVAANTKITNTMEVKAEAKITSDSTAVVNNVKIAPENKDDKITLQGTFKDVEVAKEAKVEVAAGTKIENVEVKAQADVVVEKGAEVGTIDTNNNNVNLDNQGTIEHQENTGGTPPGNNNPPPYNPPPTPTGDNSLDTAVNDIVTLIKAYNIIKGSDAIKIDFINNGVNNTINVTLKKSTYETITVEGMMTRIKDRITNKGHLSASDVTNLASLKSKLNAIKVGGVSIIDYIAGKQSVSQHTALSGFLSNMDDAHYTALVTALNSASYDTYEELIAAFYAILPSGGADLPTVNGYGLTLSQISVNSQLLYDANSSNNKRISVTEIEGALGITNTKTTEMNMLVNKPICFTLTDGTYNYNYTITLGFHD